MHVPTRDSRPGANDGDRHRHVARWRDPDSAQLDSQGFLYDI
jgi:hypothetical protein